MEIDQFENRRIPETKDLQPTPVVGERMSDWIRTRASNLGLLLAGAGLIVAVACSPERPSQTVIATSTPGVELTATQIIPTATPEIKKAMTKQERLQAVEKVRSLAGILSENIQATFYTLSNRAYYEGLPESTDEQLAQFLSKHYKRMSIVHKAWFIGIGPDNSLELHIENHSKDGFDIWVDLIKVRDLTLSPLQKENASEKITPPEVKQLAGMFFRLPRGMVWRWTETEFDGGPGTIGEYTSPPGEKISIWRASYGGHAHLEVIRPSPPGR